MTSKATTHITITDRPLCGSNSLTAVVNSADCSRCQTALGKLIELLLKAAGTGSDADRLAAGRYADKLGFDVLHYGFVIRGNRVVLVGPDGSVRS